MAVNRLNNPVANVAPEQRVGGIVDSNGKICPFAAALTNVSPR